MQHTRYMIIIFIITLFGCAQPVQTADEKAYLAIEERLSKIKPKQPDTLFSHLSRIDTVGVSEEGDSIYYINKYYTIGEATLQRVRDSVDNLQFLLSAAIEANAICETIKAESSPEKESWFSFRRIIVLIMLGVVIWGFVSLININKSS